MDEENFNLTICPKDVYDFAADIASEFENIVNVCGHDLVNPVVNKVITVLEHLETVVGIFQSVGNYVTDLKRQISELQIKKIVYSENKIKLEQDLADVEQSWIEEIQQLKSNLSQLQEDNKHLQLSLKEQLQLHQSKDSKSDQELIHELRDIVVSLNSRLKEKNSLLEKHVADIIMLKSTIEQQNQANHKLHNRISKSQAQLQSLWQDKLDLTMKIQKQKEALEAMQKQFSELMEPECDYAESVNPNQIFLSESRKHSIQDESLKHYEQDREMFLRTIHELEYKLMNTEKKAEQFKRKYLDMCKVHRPILSNKTSAIRQLFRFFLGVVASESENFRS